MTFQTTIQPGGYRFPTEDHETILEAALRNGFTLPYSCREGVCGVCKGKIIEGQVDHGSYLSDALTNMEKAAGMTLFCCARPKSDLVLECHTAGVMNDIPIRIMPCRVHKMSRMTDDIMVLQFELPAGEKLRFFAGQYISILPKDQRPRNFFMANAPLDDELLELHIRRDENDSFAQHVFNEMKERDILRFKGPQGDFRLCEKSEKPVIFVAGLTGFAPIKAMIEQILHLHLQRPMHLYWGVHKPADLYMLDRVAQWESSGLIFTPIISEASAEDGWQGKTGTVQQAVLDDFCDLSGHEVYACGLSTIVDAEFRDLTEQRGLPDESFFSNASAAMSEFRSPFKPFMQSPFMQV